MIFNIVIGQNVNKKTLILEDKPVNSGSYCMQTIFNKLNNSSRYFQTFLDKEIGLTVDGESIINLKNGSGTITMTYVSKILQSLSEFEKNSYKIKIRYTVFLLEKEMFVEKLDIWGNWDNVANIFIKYYPTSINIEKLKNNKTTITSYYIEDRADFTTTIENEQAIGRIKVRSTSNMLKNDFIKKYTLK